MLKLLGSQVTIVIFLIIGAGIVFLINSAKKDNIDEKTGNSIFGGCGCLGLIIAIICYILYTCSNVE